MAKTKTLVIGIGTTGLRIIEQAQQVHYEFVNKNRPSTNSVEYMYIETDTNCEPRKTASGKTDIDQVFFPLNSAHADIEILKSIDGLDTSWIPEIKEIETLDAGAGGLPSYGRLGFWANNNYKELRNKIKKKFENIQGDPSTQILVVGTLTGGTGSGVCVDVGYLVRDTLATDNVNAILLLPDRHSFTANKVLHENAFAATSSINYYNHKDNSYKVKYPDLQTYSAGAKPPFQYCQYISQDYADARASINNLEELIRVAGVTTMLHFFATDKVDNGFTETILKRRVDSLKNDRIKRDITSGFFMVQYPKAQMKELLSIEVAREKFSNLLNTTHYRDHNGKKQIIASSLLFFQNDAKMQFENILSSVMNFLDSSQSQDGNGSLLNSFNAKVQHVLDGKIESGSDKKFIYDQFSSVTGGNYFEVLNNNTTAIKDKMIDELDALASKITDKHKNFKITDIYFETIQDYISELIEFYSERYSLKMGFSGSEYDIALENELNRLYSNISVHTITLQKSNALLNLFQELLFILKLHVLIPMLSKLKTELNGSKEIPSTINKNHLPNKGVRSQVLKSVQTFAKEESSENVMTLGKRKEELEDQLTRFTNCFQMVYATGSKDGDMTKATEEYKKSGEIDYKTLMQDNENGGIWKFCQKSPEEMYGFVLKRAVEFMNNQEFFQSTNLKTILEDILSKNDDTFNLKNKFEGNKEEIKRAAVPAMLYLDKKKYIFGDDSCAKLIVVTSETQKYNDLFKEYDLTVADSNCVDLPGLKDVIIFYQEYGHLQGDAATLNVPKHLYQTNNVKTHIKNKLDNDDQFHVKKFPYLKKEDVL